MSEELKPCPFCGSAVKMAQHKGSDETGERWDYFAVECRGKDHNVICDAGDTAEEVAAAWNRRASPIPTPEGQGGGEDAAKLIEWCELQVQLRDYAEFMADGVQRDRILHERNRYLQIARLLSTRGEERRREALEEAAAIAEAFAERALVALRDATEHTRQSCVNRHSSGIAIAAQIRRALSLQVG